jgi:TPP-dependent 2-oxoacid decarboxylase
MVAGVPLPSKQIQLRRFSEAIELAQSHKNGPSLVECGIEQDDCSKELITWGHYVAATNSRPGPDI